MKFPLYENATLQEVYEILGSSSPIHYKLVVFLLRKQCFLAQKTIIFKSSKEKRVEAICKDSLCQFYYLATKKKGNVQYEVSTRMAIFEHTCDEFTFLNEKRSSVPSTLYASISSTLNASSNLKIKGSHIIDFFFRTQIVFSDVQNQIQNLQKNPPKYHQASKVRRLIQEDVFGSIELQYGKLESFSKLIQETDISSTTIITKDTSNVFIRFFWSYGASSSFVSLQRPLLCVDSGWIKKFPNGNLFVLGSEDMESEQVILAIMWTREAESESEWKIFFQYCLSHIHNLNSNGIGIISDRSKGMCGMN